MELIALARSLGLTGVVPGRSTQLHPLVIGGATGLLPAGPDVLAMTGFFACGSHDPDRWRHVLRGR